MEKFSRTIEPNWKGFMKNLRREGTPERVYFIELFLDLEIHEAICRRFGLHEGLDPSDPFYAQRLHIKLQRFLGYDFVRVGLDALPMPLNVLRTDDTAPLTREAGRHYQNEHRGPITNWEEFEKYPWPDPTKAGTTILDWLSENLPEDMGMILFGGFAHFCEYLTWLMGYETLCFALYDQRDLVQTISDRLLEMFTVVAERMLRYERIEVIWGSDDMGFRGGTLISPDDLREFVLPGHKKMAALSHEAGRSYILHACGNLTEIMEDLIDDVKIDGKHSFEDTIEQVTDAKKRYGDRIALLGGIDVDFLCRADEQQVRRRVRETLEVCLPGGGYCLGTGNSVANYIPVDNYLAMLDEGRRFL